MKIIAGLGNPGPQYMHTKHNAGFLFLDRFASQMGIEDWRERFHALVAEGWIGAEKVLLMKPMTYMNESGSAVGPMLDWYKLAPEDLLVVHDDMDLPPGMIRLRAQGSAGGHNGVKSIIAHIHSEKFCHVRIGIGRPLPQWSVIDHVLAPFQEEDVPKIREAIDALVPAVECAIRDGIEAAMSRYNPKRQRRKKAGSAEEAEQAAAQEQAQAEDRA